MSPQRLDVVISDTGRIAGQLFGVGEQRLVAAGEVGFLDRTASEGIGCLVVLVSLRPQEERVGDRSVVATQERRHVGGDHLALDAGQRRVGSEMDSA